MRYETYIALRYLKSSRKSFLSTIAAISAIGVILGVTALSATISVASGFQKAYRERVLGVYPHIMLQSSSAQFSEYREVLRAVEQVPEVEWASPFVRQPLMLYTSDGRSMVLARGIDVGRVQELREMGQYVVDGDLAELSYDPLEDSESPPGIFIGTELARELRAQVGTEVTAVSYLRGVGSALGPSQMAPTSGMFRVVGVFEFGFHDFDADLILVDLRAVQSFINRGDVVTGIDVRLTDPLAAPTIARVITGRLTAGAYQALTWHEINRNLFESLKINKMWLAIIMTCMVVVASFNILSTLILMVLDKTKEIAILKSMGASRSGIMRVFVLQGLFVGVVGTLLGLVGGVVVCELIEQINFGLDPAVYKISSLTVDMRLMEFVVVGVVAVFISFVATLYPSWRAGRLSPVDGLRYD